jgi:L-lactate dehydrogenase complex protein LldF
MHAIPEWEDLRELVSQIKRHTLAHLDHYLEQFEANARVNGVHVHCAVDGAAHNHIVHDILRDHGAKRLIKSKSMLTEECGFRHYMATTGIDVIETDLGERIQQLDNEDPSTWLFRQRTSCGATWRRCSAARWDQTRTAMTWRTWRSRSGRRHGR